MLSNQRLSHILALLATLTLAEHNQSEIAELAVRSLRGAQGAHKVKIPEEQEPIMMAMSLSFIFILAAITFIGCYYERIRRCCISCCSACKSKKVDQQAQANQSTEQAGSSQPDSCQSNP